MTFPRPAMVGLGAIVGASLRWGITDLLKAQAGGIPWALVIVNLVGSMVLGAVTGRTGDRTGQAARDFLGVGFAGGLTTMSSLAVEIARSLTDLASRSVVDSAGLLAWSVTSGVAGFVIARRAARRRNPGAST